MESTLLPDVRDHFERDLEYSKSPKLNLKSIQNFGIGKVLEVGCGAKFSLVSAEEKYALDITPSLLRELRRQDSNINLVLADVRNLPFIDGIFDVVLAVFLLHHLVSSTTAVSKKNVGKCLEEMARVSEECGTVLIFEHLAENRIFSSVFFYVTLIFARLNLDFRYLDIHDRVVTYYLDERTFIRLARHQRLTYRVMSSDFWQYRNFRLGYDKLSILRKVRNKIEVEKLFKCQKTE